MVRSGVRFPEAGEEWLRFIREDGECKPSTLVDYQLAFRAYLLPGTSGAHYFIRGSRPKL